MKRSSSSSKDPIKAIFKDVSSHLDSEGKQALTRQLEKMDAATLKRVIHELDAHERYQIKDILLSAAMGWTYRAWTESVELIQGLEQAHEQDAAREAWAKRLTPQELDATDLPPHYAYTRLVLLPLLRTCFDDRPSDVELALESSALEGAHPTALLGLATTLHISTTPTLEAQRALYRWDGDDEPWEEDEYWEEEDDDEDEDEDEDDEERAQLRALAIEGFTICINNLLSFGQPLATQRLHIESHLRPEDIQPALARLYQLQGAHISDISLAVDRVNLVELIKWSTTSLPLERLELDLSKEDWTDDEQLERYELDLELELLTQRPDALAIKALTIIGARLKPGSLQLLLESPTTSQLETLTLIHNELGDEDAHVIASAAPTTLSALCLDQNLLTQEGVAALAATPRLQALQTFSMNGALIAVEDLGQLRRSQEERFGELRSLLQQPPSIEGWSALCATLDLWPDMEQLEQEIIPYISSHMESWPHELCVLPERWLLRLKSGLKVPMIGLVKALWCDWPDEDRDLFAQELGDHATLRIKSLAVEVEMQLTTKMIEVFTQRPAFQGLESLRLRSYQWDATDNTQRALLKAHYPKLTTLHLWGYRLPEIFEEVLSAPYLSQLTKLELFDTELELDELKQLKASGIFARLERFALAESELTPAELKTLLKTPAPHLKHLDLSANQLTAKALEGLLTSTFGEQLTTLNFSYNSLTRGDPFEKLKDAALCLERLNLGHTGITNKALTSLAQCKWLQHVKSLDLTENRLGRSKGLKALLSSPHLSNLEELLLEDEDDLDDELYLIIRGSTTLPQVVRDYYKHYTDWLNED